MKKLLHVAVAAFLLAALHSCKKVVGEGPIVTSSRSSANFTSISSSIAGNLNVRQDNVYKIEIQAQQNIQDIIRTNVINNELVIKFKDGVNVRSHEDIIVNISAPDIRGLRLSGSANMTVVGDLSTPGLDLGISGSGNISVPRVTATDVQATISGSGNISILDGTASTTTFRIGGSGNIDALNLQSLRGNTTTSGSGATKINASQNLEVNISGSGSVYYKGTPIVNSHSSGSGNLIHVN